MSYLNMLVCIWELLHSSWLKSNEIADLLDKVCLKSPKKEIKQPSLLGPAKFPTVCSNKAK